MSEKDNPHEPYIRDNNDSQTHKWKNLTPETGWTHSELPRYRVKAYMDSVLKIRG